MCVKESESRWMSRQVRETDGVMPSPTPWAGRIWGVLEQVGDTHLMTFIMGVGAFAIMMSLKKYAPRMPGVLIAVAVTTLLSWVIGFEKMGGAVVGVIPEGLPNLIR